MPIDQQVRGHRVNGTPDNAKIEHQPNHTRPSKVLLISPKKPGLQTYFVDKLSVAKGRFQAPRPNRPLRGYNPNTLNRQPFRLLLFSVLLTRCPRLEKSLRKFGRIRGWGPKICQNIAVMRMRDSHFRIQRAPQPHKIIQQRDKSRKMRARLIRKTSR